MIDVNICLSPTVIRKYLWFNIHMDSYLPITFWYIIYIQKQYLCWIFVSLKMFTPNLQYSYQTGLEWLKEGVKSIFLNDSRSFWSIHVQEDNKPTLEKHSLCRMWRLVFRICDSLSKIPRQCSQVDDTPPGVCKKSLKSRLWIFPNQNDNPFPSKLFYVILCLKTSASEQLQTYSDPYLHHP